MIERTGEWTLGRMPRRRRLLTRLNVGPMASSQDEGMRESIGERSISIRKFLPRRGGTHRRLVLYRGGDDLRAHRPRTAICRGKVNPRWRDGTATTR